MGEATGPYLRLSILADVGVKARLEEEAVAAVNEERDAVRLLEKLLLSRVSSMAPVFDNGVENVLAVGGGADPE